MTPNDEEIRTDIENLLNKVSSEDIPVDNPPNNGQTMSALQDLNECQFDATGKSASNGKYFAAGLLAAAWGFLFEEKQPYMCATLIVVIILSVIYFAWDTWRSFKVASVARNLWDYVELGIYDPEQAIRLYNQKNRWSFIILKQQLLLLIIITLIFIAYCVARLVIS